MPVQSFSANPFGLYNVHGNVFEWVQDCFHTNYRGAPTDGRAWTSRCSEDRRVLRGGSWSNHPTYLRSAFRIRGNPFFSNNVSGFRVAQTVTTFHTTLNDETVRPELVEGWFDRAFLSNVEGLTTNGVSR